jgi:glycerophosphoryl diester phosphodiesterase
MSGVFHRVGHGGASALARANSLESFDLAVEIGVDFVEFDVRAFRGELVLAHTVLHARAPGVVSFRDALRHLSGPRFADAGLHVDVKHPGIEPPVLDGLRVAHLLERTIVCSQVVAVLDRFRELEPRVRTGVSVGGRVARVSRRWSDWRAQVLSGLATGRWDALMAQHRLIEPELLSEVSERGRELYAWTVNERPAIDRLRRLGVHGIASSDPRLFAAA